jgi:Arc/MetJ family transcription regulator
MRTTLTMDADLLAEASRLTGITSKRDLIDLALRTLIRSRQRRRLTDLRGQLSFAPDYDHKALRSDRE